MTEATQTPVETDASGIDMPGTEGRLPTMPRSEIPSYFGGKSALGRMHYDHALYALVALTKLQEDDAALRFILMSLDDATATLQEEACEFGKVVGQWPQVAEYGHGIDNWPDEAAEALTGKSVTRSP